MVTDSTGRCFSINGLPEFSRRQLMQSVLAFGVASPLLAFNPLAASAQEGGTAIVANYAMPVDLEPGKIPSFMSWFVLQNIGEGLTRLTRAEDGSLAVEPLLAESYSLSEDGLTWTFKLRSGVVFHDGTPLTADSIVFSHDRIMNSENPYYDPAFEQYGIPLRGMIESITVVDDLTVDFVLKNASIPYFLNWEAFILAVSRPAVEEFGAEFGVNVVGTGPFELDAFDAPNNTIEIARNENYWQAGIPVLDRVIWQAVSEPATRLALLETGDADVAAIMPPELGERISGNPDLRLDAASVPNFNAIAFYLDQPPFDNLTVRQAIAHALDRQALSDTLYSGFWTPAINNRWMDMTGWEDYSPYPYDPEKASALLAEAGYASGLEFTLDMPTSSSGNPAGTRWGEMIQDQLSQVGVTVTLNAVESGAYWTSINTRRPDTAIYYTRQIFVGDVFNEWISLWVDPPEGVQSYSAVPGLAEVAAELGTTNTKEEYDAVIAKLWTIIDDTLPYIAIANGSWLTGMRTALQGFQPQGIGTYFSFSSAHLE